MITSDLALVLGLGLVVYRATRVFTIDTISEPWREWFYRQVQKVGADKRSLARWGHTLLTCPFCLSVWFSFLFVALYVALVGVAGADDWLGWDYPFAALAVAGAACLMISVDLRLNKTP